MATVVFEHVGKVFPGGTRALSDVNLEIGDGELMVVVGPSGCGKSTVLRLLAGLESVTEGTIRIGGRVANDLTPQERNVAMVFQDYALYPQRTVRGNLEFPLRMRGVARDEMRRKVEWAAALLDIAPLLERLPKQLSGGQRQRVAMGRALVREPAVFLLDEPLSNLDARLRVQVRGEIGDLQRRTRATMLYVTHDQVEAMTLGDRVTVLDQGRVQQVASPTDLYDRPANAFVAGFIGSPPMNLFPARLSRNDGGGLVVAFGGERLALSPERFPETALRSSIDRPLTAGFRPEDVRVAEDGDASGTLTVRVDEVEFLGHEALATVRLASDEDLAPLIVRLPGGRHAARGDTIRLRVDPGRIHLFDESGVAISRA